MRPAIALLPAITAVVSAADSSLFQDLSLRMLASIKDRGQATLGSSGGTGLIKLGIFWQALEVGTEPAPVSEANDALRPLLYESLASTVSVVSNATRDASIPLDRFSLGAAMIAWQLQTGNASFVSPLTALNDSLQLQPRNGNGGLWYYNNLDSLAAYQNLSYLDGVYSYAPYTVLEAHLSNSSEPAQALQSVLEQIQILHDICVKPSGLLVHGYDALGAHTWANGTKGASPEVWGRSLAWYSLGLINTLETAALTPELQTSEAYKQLRTLFQEAMDAQIEAAKCSKAITGRLGVWQVVDRPGERGNFVEASSSFMTVYNILRGIRMSLLGNTGSNSTCKQHQTRDAIKLATEIYGSVAQQYLVAYANGSLSLNGTSSIASLSSQKVSYEYYVSRPTEMDSLIGTSAFAMASYEMAQLYQHQ